MSKNQVINDIKTLTMELLYNVNKLKNDVVNENQLEIYNNFSRTDINDQIDKIIRNKVNYILDNRIKIDSSCLNTKYMDFFFYKNSNNIVCTIDFTGHFIKINDVFSKYIGYTNEEVYQQRINNYIIKWESMEYINDTKTKCKNTYKTKNDKYITFEWYNIIIENCYYCIGKVIEDIKKKFIINEKYLQLDDNKTKILNNFNSKKELSSLLQVSLYKLNKIIDKKEKFNDFYYIKYKDCPKNLIDIYELEQNHF